MEVQTLCRYRGLMNFAMRNELEGRRKDTMGFIKSTLTHVQDYAYIYRGYMIVFAIERF